MTQSSRLWFLVALVLVWLVFGEAATAQNRLKVVTTLPDLADIVSQVGGDRVEVGAIATGFQNPHFVDPKPSHILKLSRADMFVTVGLDLEIGWVDPLLNSSRNPDILKGARGYVDASKGVHLLQVPADVSRDQGDIHVYGNPHYWLDPENGHVIARNVHSALVRLLPEAKAAFDANLSRFDEELDAHIRAWEDTMRPWRGTSIIAYHNQWPYFEHAFGLKIAEFLEPKPGIPPTASQLARVIGLMNEEGLRVIVISPYYKRDSADLVARKTNGTVVPLATSVGAFDGVDTYFDLFDYNVETISDALTQMSN